MTLSPRLTPLGTEPVRGVGGDQCRGGTRFIFIRLVGVRGEMSRGVEGEILLEYEKGRRGRAGVGFRAGERDQGSGLEPERGNAVTCLC